MSSHVQRIGHYRLGKNLGIGSFGKVRLAEHQLTGKKVAVKILNRNRIRQLDMDEKVRREIKILKLFYHPHIIRLYEIIYTPTDIYMVMEYVPGGELFDFIVSNGRLSEPRARAMFQQLISGVEYCHQHAVVMKDGDFFKTSCGSPNYAAPEVISGKLYAGPEVDVWSCGDLISRMLVVDPLQRITIPEIRRHRWFTDELPLYLSVTPDQIMSQIRSIDQDVLMEVAVQRRWHLGVQSSMSPADMMLEIFRALRVLQFEWKIVAQYSLKCRPCTARTASEGMGQEPMTRFKVKVGLQLYKIQEDSYLLDIRKVDGDVLPFMDVCSLLLSELKL
ncbi:hypothetical protein EMIHUDRAFT_356164 [Emiliania huxleyi CCMP1516]|uniref:non-specific serine/threonine protein kinase n=2 Tax=Emiliania huxleyi TaxID=2903 RepID=A0A0D3IYP7_EMIH1|nr:hypothetical protein EMIHUDRAFT_356164 [Emiliania huxleyi CCMP1516]EOD16382.1 hypothetical protein EMIHUDRAFT_356164 [Emiliania huxleyi CCMP1516]|eukprot:XP_005768811.1 hypothetical protein EMIHUDRAFT_356164 [Emiliania huxleyi CCMP1516]